MDNKTVWVLQTDDYDWEGVGQIIVGVFDDPVDAMMSADDDSPPDELNHGQDWTVDNKCVFTRDINGCCYEYTVEPWEVES